MNLLQALFGTSVTVIGEDGQPQPESETGGFADKLLSGFTSLFAPSAPRDCQNCDKLMRGPICPHCGETQAGYDYSH